MDELGQTLALLVIFIFVYFSANSCTKDGLTYRVNGVEKNIRIGDYEDKEPN